MAQVVNLYRANPASLYRGAGLFVGRAKLLGSPKRTAEGNGLDDLGTLVYTIQVPKHLTKQELKEALSFTFSSHGCNHSYDCCGCAVNNAWTHKMRVIRRGQVSLPISFGRNY